MDRNISERLKQIRIRLCGKRGAKEFARRAGIVYDTYLNYEKGTNIPATALVRLTKNCRINTEWLLLGRGDPLLDAGGMVRERPLPYGRHPREAVCPGCGLVFRPEPPLTGKRVLLCDPTAFAGGYRHSVVESLGALVELCTTIVEIERLKDRYDAALLECWWPSGCDEGLRLAGLMREEKIADRIILLSSEEGRIDRSVVESSGADSYVVVSPSREQFRKDILAVLSPPSPSSGVT